MISALCWIPRGSTQIVQRPRDDPAAAEDLPLTGESAEKLWVQG